MYNEAPKVLGIKQIQIVSIWCAILGSWGVVWLFEPYQGKPIGSEIVTLDALVVPVMGFSQTQLFLGLLTGLWVYWFVSQYLLFFLNDMRASFLHPAPHLYEIALPDAFEKLCDYLALKQINFGDKWRKEIVDQQNNRIHYAISWVTEQINGKGRIFYKNNLRLSIKLTEAPSGNTWIKFDWEPLSEYDYNAIDPFIEETQKELDESLELGLFALPMTLSGPKPPAPPIWLLLATALAASICLLAFIAQGWNPTQGWKP